MFGSLVLIFVILILLLVTQNLDAFGRILVGEFVCLSITECANSIGGTG